MRDLVVLLCESVAQPKTCEIVVLLICESVAQPVFGRSSSSLRGLRSLRRPPEDMRERRQSGDNPRSVVRLRICERRSMPN